MLILGGRICYYKTRIPNSIRRRLRQRQTNTVAFELIAAILSILVFVSKVEPEVHMHHYIDSTAALGCIVRGFSRQHDVLSYHMQV